MITIPFRSTVGPHFQASKWLKYPVLLDTDEMQELMLHLGKFWIVQTSGVIPLGQAIISSEVFLEVYHHYMVTLKRGEVSQDPRQRSFFSAIFTTTLEALYLVKINSGCLVKVQQPVIQLQAHRFDYSFADETFRSMVLGYESIQWGLQFAYPQLYQNEKLQIFSFKEQAQFPNNSLFKRLQHWIRHQTIATPFEVQGKRTNVPIRLGKQCLSWINTHPQLQAKGLKVVL